MFLVTRDKVNSNFYMNRNTHPNSNQALYHIALPLQTLVLIYRAFQLLFTHLLFTSTLFARVHTRSF